MRPPNRPPSSPRGSAEIARATAHTASPGRYRDHHVLDEARTGDKVWNAAQRQPRLEERIHGYLRTL